MQSSKGELRRAPIDPNLRTCWLCHEESMAELHQHGIYGEVVCKMIGRCEEGLISKESGIGVLQVVYHVVDMLRSTFNAASHQVMSRE
jgi:hypothetical protein